MKLLLKISVITLFSILCFGFYSKTNAQTQTPIDGVTIDISNDNPKPGENVDVFIESYLFDLNSASIVWTVNGKVNQKGVGMKRITIPAPKIGTVTDVSVDIKGSDGREVKKAISVRSGYVDLIWESDGYVPPFYKGKTPFSYQNNVKVTAIPHLAKTSGTEIDPKTLVYTWKLGGKYIDNGQGYGKQSVVVEYGDIPKTLEITVDVINREQTLHTVGTMNLTPSEPSLLFYEEDSLYGIFYNKVLPNNFNLKNVEAKILAIPYGFNLNNQEIDYNWSINNIEQSDLLKNRSIIIRTKGDTSGSSNLLLDIRNQDRILQGARGAFTINFKKKDI
jgi:hypothetical protein